MPPGYWDLLSALGYEGIANNLKQTSFGKYGRQADKPKFKPAWATKNLRSTDSGAKIRQGQYDDSPNKFSRRTVTNAALADMEARNAGPPLELDPSQQEQHRPPISQQPMPRAVEPQSKDETLEASSTSIEQDPVMEGPEPSDPQDSEHYEEDDYEEEVVEEEYEEEAPATVDTEVEDLQRILAEKMAELARLQAGG